MTDETSLPPASWATTEPREGLRDNNAARIVSLAPGADEMQVGSQSMPYFANMVDFCGHDENYAQNVNFTGQKAMLLRSKTQHVHGGGNGGVCEPIGHARQVFANKSPVVCHLHKFHMDNRRTVGEAQFVRDTACYPAPKDTDPIPGSAYVTLVDARAPAFLFEPPNASPAPTVSPAPPPTAPPAVRPPGSPGLGPRLAGPASRLVPLAAGAVPEASALALGAGAAVAPVIVGGGGLWFSLQRMQGAADDAARAQMGLPPAQRDPFGIPLPPLNTQPLGPAPAGPLVGAQVDEFFTPFVAQDPAEQAMIDAAKQRVITRPSPETLRREMADLDKQLEAHRRDVRKNTVLGFKYHLDELGVDPAGNVRVTGRRGPDPKNPCLLIPYGLLSCPKPLGSNTGASVPAHHAVADRAFRASGRQGMPMWDQTDYISGMSEGAGLAMCLEGDSTKPTTPHGIATDVYETTTETFSVNGMVRLGIAEGAAGLGIEAATGGRCNAADIQAQLRAYHQAKGMGPDTWVRQQQLPLDRAGQVPALGSR